MVKRRRMSHGAGRRAGKRKGQKKGGSGTQQRDGEHEDRDPNKANSDYVHRAASNNIIIRILIERFMLATALAPQRR